MRALFAVAVLADLAILAARAQEPAGGNAKIITYRGWEGCVELANHDARVVIVPAVGARIAEFSWGGKNVLFVDHAVDGKVAAPGQAWMPWDGSQPDTMSPQGGSQLEHIWLGKYEVVNATGLSAYCRSRDNTAAGIRMEKEFILDPKQPLLTIKQRIVNIADKPSTWSFWERTLLPGGSIGVAPVNTKGVCGPAGWLQEQKDNQFGPGVPVDGNPSVADGFIVARTTTKGTKVGMDAWDGWTSALVDGLLFVVTYPVPPNAKYPRGPGLNNVFFFADNRLEFEPVSPYLDLAPGASAEWTIRWSLQSFGDVPADAKELVGKVRNTIKRQ